MNLLNKNNNIFCNNCGKNGHNYNNCKYPITSIGIIAYRYNHTKHIYEYLMIRRKHTLGFVDFMRGRYSIHNFNYIMNIINEMTIYEKELLLNKNFNELWLYLWGNKITFKYKNEKQISESKYNILKNGIHGINKYSLESCIKQSNTKWIDQEWGFPKGRRNYREKDLDTGIREFCEETGYNISNLDIIHNLHPLEEIFTGSNFKSYKHKYFLAQIHYDSCNNLNNYDKCEVSKLEWKSLEESINCIRPYNIEKIKLIQNVHKILHKYKFSK